MVHKGCSRRKQERTIAAAQNKDSLCKIYLNIE
jgi:hypothetical protein